MKKVWMIFLVPLWLCLLVATNSHRLLALPIVVLYFLHLNTNNIGVEAFFNSSMVLKGNCFTDSAALMVKFTEHYHFMPQISFIFAYSFRRTYALYL